MKVKREKEHKARHQEKGKIQKEKGKGSHSEIIDKEPGDLDKITKTLFNSGCNEV